MQLTKGALETTLEFLTGSRAVADKIGIREAYAPALETTLGEVRLGDDCAAIPDTARGYLLLAAEGLLGDFVADDPWFAGYSAVMVNVNDVCAMGGRPIAVVDVVSSPDAEASAPVWAGMKAAAKAYRVPIVGGHTTLTRTPARVTLAAAILGRASVLLTSFDAEPGDELLVAVDLNGTYRKDKPFWNASVGASPERLHALMEILPEVAERGLCRAAKDISNGGIVGTLIMLLECSKAGATLELENLPRPPGVDLRKWLVTFPSFGYLLSVPRRNRDRVRALFDARDVAVGVAGAITDRPELELRLEGESRVFWRSPAAES